MCCKDRREDKQRLEGRTEPVSPGVEGSQGL